MNELQQHMEHQRGVVETRKGTKDTYDKMCDVEAVNKERIQDFIKSAPKYNGDPEIIDFDSTGDHRRDFIFTGGVSKNAFYNLKLYAGWFTFHWRDSDVLPGGL